MKRLKLFFQAFLTLMLICCIKTVTAQGQPFTAGNIVVCRIGNGSATLSSTANPVFLDEFTTSGNLVQSIALPTTASGSNNILTMNATGGGVPGLLNLSVNGQYLTVPGFNVAVGTSSITGSHSNIIQRTIGVIKYDGTVNTSTALIDYCSQGSPSSAVSSDGTSIWCVGAGTANNDFGTPTGGVRYTTIGSTSSTQLNTSILSGVNLNITANQLNYSSSSASRMYNIPGLPTTSGQTASGFPSTAITTFANLLQFALFDLDPTVTGPDVLYVVCSTSDPGQPDDGGILKFSLVGGNWVFNGRIGQGSDFYTGLTGVANGSTVTLYVTKAGTNASGTRGGDLATATDVTGYNAAPSGTVSVISSINAAFGYAANTASFRGVAFVPQPPNPKVTAKIFLQGAYSTGLGRHKDVTSTWASVLNSNALSQPYNTSAFGNYAGTENVAGGFFQSTGNTTDIVDWVLVELHDATTPSTIIARRAAFVREDGQVVDLDGLSPVSFPGTSSGSYYLVIKHRNHLPVRSSVTITVDGSPSASATSYDFTTAQSQAYQDGSITSNAAMVNIGSTGVFGMWAGNANSNTKVSFTGLQNDAGAILSALGGNQALIQSGYYSADVNMDGSVKYTGLNNDAGALLSVLGSNQAAIINQHQ